MNIYLAATALIFISINCHRLADRDDPDILDVMNELEIVYNLEKSIDENIANAYAKNEETYMNYVAGKAELDEHLKATDATVRDTTEYNLNIREENRDHNQRSDDDFIDL